MHGIVTDAGAICRPPTAGFYVYPDFAPLREMLAGRGVHDAQGLERFLLDELGVATLGGHHFGDAPELLRLRLATSMLYGGSGEQQSQALRAGDPLRTRHVADVLARLAQAFATLTEQTA